MGLLYLTTLYAAIRCAEGRRRTAWGAAAVAACACGMGVKEVMVTAPLAVLLYDLTFLSGSLRAALRERWGLHLGLAATWGVIFVAIGPDTLLRGEFARSTLERATPLEYAATQPGVILHYLRLSVWPHPLCFDYGWPKATDPPAIAASVLGVAALAAGSAAALWRRHWLGFVGAWFFLILAPTSSVVPIADMAVEHRMYLPLAACVALVVVGGYGLARRLRRAGPAIAWILLAAAAVALGIATVHRNRDYRSDVSLWQTVARAAPANSRGHYNLGSALRAAGRSDESIPHFVRALAIDPTLEKVHYNLANALKSLERIDEAVHHYRRAIELDPDHVGARVNLGNALVATGNLEEGIAAHQSALRILPDDPTVNYNLGVALEKRDRLDEAVTAYRRTLSAAPGFASAHYNLGLIFAARNDRDEAERRFREAVRFEPRHAGAHTQLGLLLLARNQPEEAVLQLRRALEIDPEATRAREGLARALGREEHRTGDEAGPTGP